MDHLCKVVKNETEITPMQFNVKEMSAAGKAKLRHVGAWAVRKVLERSRKYVRENIFTENSYTLQKVYQQQCKCELLEEHIIIPFSQIENTTKFPETLEVTENRQYRSRGLLHITDSSYMFFIALESLCVSLMNNEKLCVHRDKMVEAAHNEITKSESLKLKWKKCFSSEIDKHSGKKFQMWKTFEEVVERFLNMGASQHLRDYRRDYNIKKTEELRKAVKQRQEKKKEKTESV